MPLSGDMKNASAPREREITFHLFVDGVINDKPKNYARVITTLIL